MAQPEPSISEMTPRQFLRTFRIVGIATGPTTCDKDGRIIKQSVIPFRDMTPEKEQMIAEAAIETARENTSKEPVPDFPGLNIDSFKCSNCNFTCIMDYLARIDEGQNKYCRRCSDADPYPQ